MKIITHQLPNRFAATQLFSAFKNYFFIVAFFFVFTGMNAQNFTINDPTPVNEGNVGDVTTLTFTITLNDADFFNNSAVEYTINGGNEDGVTGVLSFGFFTPTEDIDVTFNGNFLIDGDKPISIILSNPTNATIADDTGESSFLDDDVAGVLVNGIDSASGPVTGTAAEDGSQTASFTFSLTSEPTADVEIALSGYGTQLNGAASITIPVADWQTGVVLDVTSVDDVIDDGDVSVAIATGDVTSTDTDYNLLADVDVADLSVTSIDNDTANLIVSAISGPVSEDETTTATFTVVLGAEPQGDIDVLVVSQDNGEVEVDSDRLTFAPADWDTPQIITVTGVDDTDVDGDVTVNINVAIEEPAADTAFDGLGTRTVAVINQDDDQFVADIINASNAVESTLTNGGFTIELDQPNLTGGDLSVNYSIGGSATAGTDYTALSGVATIANTQTSVVVNIAPIDDNIVELTENIIITLIAGTGYTIGSDNTVTIGVESEDTATITIEDVSENEDDGAITVTATLDNAVTTGFTVNGILADGTATSADNDYSTGGSRQMNFNGSASETKSFQITPIADAKIEDNETILVSLSTASMFGGLIDTSDTATVTLLNDDGCAAGNTAPNLNTSAPTEFCDVTSTDLNVYVTNAAPTGATLKWSKSNTNLTDSSTHIGNNTADESTTYYGFFYDSLNQCVSPAISVTIVFNQTPSTGTINNFQVCNTTAGGNNASADLDERITGADAGTWALTTDPSGGQVAIGSGNVVNFAGAPLGDYIFTYTTNTAQGSCSDASDTLLIRVTDCAFDCDAGNEAPTRDNSVDDNFCDVVDADLNDFVTGNAPNGTELRWSPNPDPLVTSAHRSNLVTTPGTYYGFYFDVANDCASPTIAITLVLNETPELTAANGDTICDGGVATLTADATVGASVRWYATATDDTILSTSKTFTPEVTETTIYFVEAFANGCASDRQEVVVTVLEGPSTGTVVDTSACTVAGPENPTTLDLDEVLEGEDPGTWEFVSGEETVSIGAENIVDFEGLAQGNYTFRFTTTTAEAPCTNNSIEVTLTAVNCLLDADNDGLNDDQEEILGTDPNNPDTDGDGILDGQEVNVDQTDPLDACDSVGGTPLPEDDCDSDGLTNGEEVDLGTNPFVADTDMDGLTDGEEVLVVDDPTTALVPEVASNPLDPCDPFIDSEACGATASDLEITKTVDVAKPLSGDQIIFTITVANLTEGGVARNIVVLDVLSDASAFNIISEEVAEGTTFDAQLGIWSIPQLDGEEAVTLRLTGTVAAAGNTDFTNTATIDQVVPQDIDPSNNIASVVVEVQTTECVDPGTICNIFSPNGDGINDRLTLVSAGDYPNNYLQIYDRYGNAVYEKRNYQSDWDGTGENGALPKGTYFYTLDLGDGTDVIKGWIQIIR